MGRLDFDEITVQVNDIGNSAKATLMYRLIQTMGPALLRTVIRYCCQRLDKINAELPQGERYMNYGRHNQKPPGNYKSFASHGEVIVLPPSQFKMGAHYNHETDSGKW